MVDYILIILFQKLKDARVLVGVLIEGKDNGDLPEQILGCYRLHFLDIIEALGVEV